MSASVFTVTPDELAKNIETAQKFCARLNQTLEDTPINVLLTSGTINFCRHPEVASGRLGAAYKEGSEAWLMGGALEELVGLLDNRRSGGAIKFGVGTFGSVWADVELTGGFGAEKRTKKVRLSPSVGRREDSFDIMLDNTFDEEW